MSGDVTVRIDEPSLGEPTGSMADCTFSQPEETPPRYRIVAPDGSAEADAVPDLDVETYRELFGWMVTQQVVDERMVKLQRRGEMGTYASGRGHEGSIVGFGAALEDDDWLYPYGREAAAMLINGMSLRDLMLYWRGVMDANRFPDANIFPIAIAIGTHVPVGVGYAWGMKRDDADSVMGVMFGDGHPSTGEVQAGMNFGGVLDVPCVFHCQNNGYSISMPFSRQTAVKSVAQKALAWGFDGIRVDGNDILAVYDATRRARERALDGTPVIVESVTYRLDAHTTNDDPSRYRTGEEVKYWEAREPVGRFRDFLKEQGVWDEIDEEALRESANERFDEAKEAADAYATGDVDELFEYLYDELPPELERQLEEFEALIEERPDFWDHVEERPKG
jgi:pyruvate dehydrogenase E1 component alpha subunit